MIYDELVRELGFNPDQLAPRLLPPFDKAAVLRARPRQFGPPTGPPPPRRLAPAVGVAPEPMRLIGITGTRTNVRVIARHAAAGTDTGKARSGLFSALTGAWTVRTLMRRHA